MSFPFSRGNRQRAQVRLREQAGWRPEAQNPACIVRRERKYQSALLSVSQGRTEC